MLLARALTAVASTTASRLRRGPKLPSWGFMFETSIALLDATARRAGALPPVGQRAVWAELAPPPSPVMRRVRVSEPRALGGVPALCFEPREGLTDATVLYLHGGSFIYGSAARSHREVIARVALATGARVWAPEYRLAPEHPFPAQLDDAVAAFRALRAQGVQPSRVVLAGDSAGGNLVVTAMLALRAAGEALPAGGVLICPWVDLTFRGGSYEAHRAFDWAEPEHFAGWAAAYTAGHDPRDPCVSPAFADLHGVAPLLVQCGDHEMLRDQVRAFVERARAHGVAVDFTEYRDMVHNWHTLHAYTPRAQEALDEIGRFVRSRTAR